MEEKIITKGKFTKNNFISFSAFALSIISLIISIVIFNPAYYDETYYASWVEEWIYTALIIDCPEGVGVFFYLFILFAIVGAFIFIMMNSCEITVTDKRVFGKSAFGKMVDLPLDKISSVGSCFPMGIKVATSSGAIGFWLLSNQSEVFSEISKLLQKRQTPTEPVLTMNTSNADELKKYKELLDSGIITQEEFDAKKKQLLGL